LLAPKASARSPRKGWSIPSGFETDLAVLKEAACVPGSMNGARPTSRRMA